MNSAAMSDPGRSRWLNLLSMLAVATVTFALYSRALDFGFFNDDPTGHFAWMETRSYADFLRTSADYGYYRPVVFIVLQGFVDLFGYDPVAFHALLVGLNAANAALLWLLVVRLSGSRPYGWTAVLLFATFPFSYEAVTYVASLTHPLLLFWLLLTLLLYQQARAVTEAGQNLRRNVYYAAAMVTMVLGLLTHENGFLIPLALVGVDWLQQPPTGFVDGLKRPFLAYLAVVPLFLVLWWTIPKTSEQTLPTFPEWYSNLIPFLQSLVYPLLPIFHLTADQTAALLVLVLATLAGLFLAAWLARAAGLWLFALAWFLLSALPATLFLAPDYLYGSPRLHYLPSVGVAMLWALPVLALAKNLPYDLWGRVGAVASGAIYTLAIALPPLIFINCEMDFYAEATRIVREMASVGQESPAEKDLLFVNLPVFFSSYSAWPDGCENPYPWTPVGAVVIPDYASARDFVRFNGGSDLPASAVTVADYAPGWNTFGELLAASDLRQQLTESEAYVYDLNMGHFRNLAAAWQVNGASDQEPLAVFGEGFMLTSAEVDSSNLDGNVGVSLSWQASSEARNSVAPTVFVHIYDEAGQLVAQHDAPPTANLVPTAWWQEQDRVLDSHLVEPEDVLPPGVYVVGVGMYDALSGERLAASTQGGPLADDLFIVEKLIVP